MNLTVGDYILLFVVAFAGAALGAVAATVFILTHWKRHLESNTP